MHFISSLVPGSSSLLPLPNFCLIDSVCRSSFVSFGFHSSKNVRFVVNFCLIGYSFFFPRPYLHIFFAVFFFPELLASLINHYDHHSHISHLVSWLFYTLIFKFREKIFLEKTFVDATATRDLVLELFSRFVVTTLLGKWMILLLQFCTFWLLPTLSLSVYFTFRSVSYFFLVLIISSLNLFLIFWISSSLLLESLNHQHTSSTDEFLGRVFHLQIFASY